MRAGETDLSLKASMSLYLGMLIRAFCLATRPLKGIQTGLASGFRSLVTELHLLASVHGAEIFPSYMYGTNCTRLDAAGHTWSAQR